MIRGIHHSQITVRKLEESVEFYTRNFGMKLIDKMKYKVEKGDFPGLKGAEMKIAFLKAGENLIELIEYINRKGELCQVVPWNIGQMHIAIEVSDINQMYKKLKDEERIEFMSSPIESPDDIWCYFKDLNGALLELIQIKTNRSP
jgi:catechol 2,3-dioxygenase-like lactoylglutathione lyase family enzyme